MRVSLSGSLGFYWFFIVLFVGIIFVKVKSKMRNKWQSGMKNPRFCIREK